MIQTPEALAELVAKLNQETIVAFDTEFIRETTFFPQLEIIQIATESEAWIIDVQAFRRNLADFEPFLDLMRNPKILKIIHAAQADQECLFTTFKCLATPTLDTAVAASLCGYGDQQGLGSLVKSVLGIQLKKGHARTNWAVRPLPDQLVEYALADVIHLVRLGKTLIAQLDELKRRDWAMELTSKWEDPGLYDPPAETLAAKIDGRMSLDAKEFSALVELVNWRENRVRQVNRPRKWIADDGILLNLAQVSPKDMDHLRAFRGIQSGEIQKSGEAILEAIRRGHASPVEHPGHGARDRGHKPPSARESQVLSLLQCYIGILADQNKLALKHLTMSNQLLALLRTPVAAPEEWVKKGLLSRWAVDLIGVPVWEFLQGKKALTLFQGREVKITDV